MMLVDKPKNDDFIYLMHFKIVALDVTSFFLLVHI